MLKTLFVLGGLLTAATALAQPLTRAEVREELAMYRRAGYNPARMNPRSWVEDVQRASARVALERNATQAAPVGGEKIMSNTEAR